MAAVSHQDALALVSGPVARLLASVAASDLAQAATLRPLWMIDVDSAGSIGKRYRRQDEVGTPFCVTVDFETLDDHAVTVRDRDTMGQDRVPVDELVAYLRERLQW